MINLAPRDGEVYFTAGFIDPQEAGAFYQRLLGELAWSEEDILLGAKRIRVPRLVCWYGEPGVVYTYSGVSHAALPWTPSLSRLKEGIEEHTGQLFNSALGNLYRDGNDSMGWHADKEPELGPEPFIASLSLGAARLFRLRHNKTGETIGIKLTHGSLLLMGGRLQHRWRHCVPKTTHGTQARINLTFRRVFYERQPGIVAAPVSRLGST